MELSEISIGERDAVTSGIVGSASTYDLVPRSSSSVLLCIVRSFKKVLSLSRFREVHRGFQQIELGLNTLEVWLWPAPISRKAACQFRAARSGGFDISGPRPSERNDAAEL